MSLPLLESSLATRIARAVRIAVDAGVMDMNGHVSLRAPDGQQTLWINSRKASRSTLTERDIVPVDMATGERIGSGDEPPSEFHIHREMYRIRPDISAIVHAHPPAILTLSAVGYALRATSAIGTFLPEDGAPVFDTAVLINTERRGVALAQALGAAPVVVLRQHGVVVVGATLEEALVRLICSEDNARVQLAALQIGTPRYIGGEELAVLAAENWPAVAYTKHWHYHEQNALRRGVFAGLDA